MASGIVRSSLISRRAVLRGVGLAVGSGVLGSLLASCSTAPAQPTPVPAAPAAAQPTTASATPAPASQAAPVPNGPVVVHYITALWNWQKLGMATATDSYNQQNRDKVQIQVDPGPDGWETKVVEMSRSGNLVWDGWLSADSGSAFTYYKYSILQPITPFIQSSPVKWSTQFDQELLPSVKGLFTFDNQLYFLPWDSETYVRLYMVDQWAKLGGKPAETVADYEQQLIQYQQLYPSNTPLTLPEDPSNPCANYQMFGQLWSDDLWIPIQDTNMPNVAGDAFSQYLDMLKRWYTQKFVTDATLGATTWSDLWLKQKVGSAITDAAWGFSQSRQVYGLNAIDAVPPPVLKAGDVPRTFPFSNAATLFKGAKHPQEVVDWLLWMIDPTNDKPGSGTFMYSDLNYYHLPAYTTPYEKVVGTNTLWKWMVPMLPMVKASKPIPSATYVSLWNDVMVPEEYQYAKGLASKADTIAAIKTKGQAQLDKLAKP